eukprot:9503374-Pyramimonas_sp.AAC.1
MATVTTMGWSRRDERGARDAERWNVGGRFGRRSVAVRSNGGMTARAALAGGLAAGPLTRRNGWPDGWGRELPQTSIQSLLGSVRTLGRPPRPAAETTDAACKP